MKKSVLILFVALLFLTTCGPDVKFTVPQPQGISNLISIPKEYHGTFRCLTDSSFIRIDSFSVKKEWRTTEFIQRDSLEKELKMAIKHDTIIVIKDKLLLDKTAESLLLNIKLCDNSAKVRVKGYETLFVLSDSQLVRNYLKFCFLNFKTNDGYWLVKTLSLKGEQLDFSDLIDVKEIEDNNSITKITAIKDTTSGKVVEYHLNPSKRELRRVLKRKKLENNYLRFKQ